MVTESTDRYAADEIQALAAEMVALVQPTVERVEVGGSLRRGSSTVKDVEIVVLNPRTEYYQLTDGWVAAGLATKALYGKKGTTRWGDKYRGLIYQGVKFELFGADSDNWGYQYWLRTGPGDANHFVMSTILRRDAPFRFVEGYAQLGERKLSLKSELELFTLLGMPFIEPGQRNEQTYRRILQASGHRWGDATAFVAKTVQPAQRAIFDGDDPGGDIPSAANVDRRGPSEAERLYVAQHYTRRYGETAEFWLSADRPDLVTYLREKGRL